MHCDKKLIHIDAFPAGAPADDRPELPDILVDRLSGKVIPFTNLDNIRQKMLGFLLEKKGFLKEDIAVDREIRFELEGSCFVSPVDIAIIQDRKTMLIFKCASGSLVSRERQVAASARLLEEYVVPFAVVTNGQDLELIDVYTDNVVGCGFEAVPSRQELRELAADIVLKPVNRKKTAYEQRILFTYDSISCAPRCGK